MSPATSTTGPIPDAATVTGRTSAHLCAPAEAEALGASVHRDVLEPFRLLREDAAAAGFDLRILSGFRGFERQASIWNRKCTGALAVLDSDAHPVDITTLDARELVFTILRWSALPGASRHHWGTDLDVYDERARPDAYEVDLVPAEVESGGMFAALHEWLDDGMRAGSAHGFFRPYDLDRGGVAPERWHLSHAPVAADFEAVMSVEVLRSTIADSPLELREVVLGSLDEIYERFVVNTGRPTR